MSACAGGWRAASTVGSSCLLPDQPLDRWRAGPRPRAAVDDPAEIHDAALGLDLAGGIEAAGRHARATRQDVDRFRLVLLEELVARLTGEELQLHQHRHLSDPAHAETMLDEPLRLIERRRTRDRARTLVEIPWRVLEAEEVCLAKAAVAPDDIGAERVVALEPAALQDVAHAAGRIPDLPGEALLVE